MKLRFKEKINKFVNYLLASMTVTALFFLIYKFYFQWVIDNLGISGLKIIIVIIILLAILTGWIIYKDRILEKPKLFMYKIKKYVRQLYNLFKTKVINIFSLLFENIKKIIVSLLIIVFLFTIFNSDSPNDNYQKYNNSEFNYYDIYEVGYEWADDNDIEDFSDCDYEFGANTEAEDGCNKYVQENTYSYQPSFYGYECTEDCSGHKAGYNWAEEKGITDPWDCSGKSNSFIEGCKAYAGEYSY